MSDIIRQARLILRHGAESDFSAEKVEPCELTFANDTGNMFIKKTDGSVVRFGADYYSRDEVDQMMMALIGVPESWLDVRKAVRAGVAKKMFPIGAELGVDGYNGSVLDFRVCGYDTILPKNSELTHSMVLELVNVYGSGASDYSTITFDAPEALYFAAAAHSPGTYHFRWNENGDINAGDYQFTLTQALPAGGQIVLDTTNMTVTTYAETGSTEVVESGVAVTSGTGGTNLGTTGTGNLNHVQRIQSGSDNYAQSAVRQFLSSILPRVDWTPKTKFDRPPAWLDDVRSFAYDLESDFLSAVQTAVVPCRTNNVYETTGLDGTVYMPSSVYSINAKFFLLSRPEMLGTYDSSALKDGVQLDLYKTLSASERIKYDAGGTARNCMTRTPVVTNAGGIRYIKSTDGSAAIGSAKTGFGVCPACIIA